MDGESAPRYTYIWEYHVRSDRIAEFEQLYGPQGAWTNLSRQSPGYIRTELYRDRSRPGRFVTVDHWDSHESWLEWRTGFDSQFEELDRLGDRLTADEREIGRFERVADG